MSAHYPKIVLYGPYYLPLNVCIASKGSTFKSSRKHICILHGQVCNVLLVYFPMIAACRILLNISQQIN